MTSSTDPSSPGARPSLWGHHNFRRYLIEQASSVTDSSISAMVIPVLAVLELDATTAQIAWACARLSWHLPAGRTLDEGAST